MNGVDDAPGRLRWQCRRGMRELDVLLSRWLERHFDAASDAQKQAFRELLSLQDPELAAYLLQGVPAADPELARLVARIRGDDST